MLAPSQSGRWRGRSQHRQPYESDSSGYNGSNSGGQIAHRGFLRTDQGAADLSRAADHTRWLLRRVSRRNQLSADAAHHNGDRFAGVRCGGPEPIARAAIRREDAAYRGSSPAFGPFATGDGADFRRNLFDRWIDNVGVASQFAHQLFGRADVDQLSIYIH